MIVGRSERKQFLLHDSWSIGIYDRWLIGSDDRWPMDNPFFSIVYCVYYNVPGIHVFSPTPYPLAPPSYVHTLYTACLFFFRSFFSVLCLESKSFRKSVWFLTPPPPPPRARLPFAPFPHRRVYVCYHVRVLAVLLVVCFFPFFVLQQVPRARLRPIPSSSHATAAGRRIRHCKQLVFPL